MSMLDQLAGIYPDQSQGNNKFELSVFDRAKLEFNDRGNAARILAAYGLDLIFVTGKGWGVWDGMRYSFASGKLRAEEVGARLPDLIQAEIEGVRAHSYDEFTLNRRMEEEHRKARGKRYLSLDEVERDIKAAFVGALYKHKIKCGNVDKQNKALKACEWQVRAEIQDLDANPWAFVVQNGVVDLKKVRDAEPLSCGIGGPTSDDLAKWRKDWLVATDRTPLPTKCAGTVFIPGAIYPEWEAFLELILPEKDIRDCLQRSFGALLFGANVAQVALLFRGGGGNGKSTLVDIIGMVLGNFDGYAVPAKVEMFLVTQNQSAGQATPEEVDLPGARAILASEPSPTDTFSAKKIKSLTGGDLRPARALGMPQFVYRPTGIPVIQFNRTPKIKDEDEGTRRRLVFFPLEVNLRELPPEQRKSPLEVQRLLKAELPGILNWMLDGFRDFQFRLESGLGTPPGIDPPESMISLKDRIMESADPVGNFLKACTDIDQKGRTRTAEFFKAFRAWAKDNGARVYQDSTLRDKLIEKGFTKVKSNGNMCFAGFKWKDDDLVFRYVNEPDSFTPPDKAYGDSDFN